MPSLWKFRKFSPWNPVKMLYKLIRIEILNFNQFFKESSYLMYETNHFMYPEVQEKLLQKLNEQIPPKILRMIKKIISNFISMLAVETSIFPLVFSYSKNVYTFKNTSLQDKICMKKSYILSLTLYSLIVKLKICSNQKVVHWYTNYWIFLN